jgi:hypothetical protein
MYHLKQGFQQIQEIPIFERKWFIDRFIEQKEREEKEIKKSRKH